MIMAAARSDRSPSPIKGGREGWDPILPVLIISILIAEVILCLSIIRFVPYTEIDWRAYMEQVATFMKGERNYIEIKGGTGPLVYPAGFLYIYSFLSGVTNAGEDIATAQLIFAGIYIATQFLLFVTLGKAALASGHAKGRIAILFLTMCLSRRLHSLYVLRLFNDDIAMLFLHLSVFLALVAKSWASACFVFSIAVSIKMNVLLFAPGLLILLLHKFPRMRTFPYLAICAITQIAIGFPFLIAHPISYLRKAFELDRQFFQIWSVNLQFLPEWVFQSKQVAICLLCCHVVVLGMFARRHWLKRVGSAVQLLKLRKPIQLDAAHALDILFISNFIGIVFSRTIHYQFYTWYGHHLPWLLFRTSWPLKVQLGIWLAIEFVYNVYPPRALTSVLLQLCHLALLIALYRNPAVSTNPVRIATTDADKSKPI